MIKKSLIFFLVSLSLFGKEFYIGYNQQSSSLLHRLNVLKDLPHLEMAIVDLDNFHNLKGLDFIIPVKKKVSLGRKHNIASVIVEDENQPLIPWGLSKIKTSEGWNKSTGKGVKVLVLDSGVDKNHPALSGQIVKIKDFTNSFEELNLPYPGYDITGHGTHIAGTILANGNQITGVAPQARLYIGKVCIFLCREHGALINGFEWALEQRVDIINMSLSSQNFPKEIADRIASKLEEYNIVAIAAAGNDGEEKNIIGFPANQKTILAVGAIDKNNKHASFSNYGPEVDIVAPGVDILSLSLTKGINATENLLKTMSGTSMATPHVTGLAALIKSLRPNLSAKEIRQIIINTANLPKDVDNTENKYGAGIIDTKAAFSLLEKI